MNKKMTFTKFFMGTLMIFSIIMLFLMVIGPLVGGGEAAEISALFSLGIQGVSYTVMWQGLVLALYAMTVQTLFLADRLFKRMMLLWRVIWMFVCILSGIGVLSVWFGWFPANQPLAWLSYLLSFGMTAGLSMLVMVIKTRREDIQVKKKLAEYKQRKQDESPSEQGA